jgi:hypothetical protein
VPQRFRIRGPEIRGQCYEHGFLRFSPIFGEKNRQFVLV